MNNWLKKIGLGIAILVMNFSMMSCKDPLENKQKMLRINFQHGKVPSLHPHLLQGHMRGHVLGKALFEGLTRINSKGEVEYAGTIAREISPNKTHYTFTLRPQKWSDDTSITASQYERAWRNAISPASDCPQADLFYVIKNAEQTKKGECSIDTVGIRALSANILSVELVSPTPYFLELLAQPMFFSNDFFGRRETII